MQLHLSAIYPAPQGDIEISVGINSKGRWAKFDYTDKRALPEEVQARRIVAAYKAIGYHAKIADVDGKLGIVTSLTQSYQTAATHTGRNLQVLTSIVDDIETFRDIIGAGVAMYRRLSPVGRAFAELSEIYNASDREVKDAIRKGLGGLIKVAAPLALSATLMPLLRDFLIH